MTLILLFRFHRVVVNHRGEDVLVTLDSQTEKMTAQKGHQHLHMDPAIYFGGLEKAHSAMGTIILPLRVLLSLC